jgi:hypothetical protein
VEREKTAERRLGTLQRGTAQRAQLRVRLADIAWTCLCVVLALWAAVSSVGAARGTTAWAYCAVAWILLAFACAMVLAGYKRRKRI